MSEFKQAYFQGGGGLNEPTPKKKKYKSEKAIVVQPRFEEPLYRNFDMYEVEGVDGPAKQGPGTGFYQNMNKYKSVSDFLKKKKKIKYKANDSYIEDNGSITKKKARMERRIALLISLAFDDNSIDFSIDDQINSSPIGSSSGTVGDANLTGGLADQYTPSPDFEGKLPTELNYGRDYTGPTASKEYIEKLQKAMDELIGMLNPKETELYGLPDGISPISDLENVSIPNSQYGTTDSGNTLYNKIQY